MHKKTTTWFTVLLLACFSHFAISTGSAYNYATDLKVGDTFVWYVENNNETYYIGINLTAIGDDGFNTRINGTESFSMGEITYDNDNYEHTLAILADYTQFPEYLVETYFIINGTKVGDYESEIASIYPGSTVTSIDNGWGVKIVDEDEEIKQIFNKQGILEYYSNEVPEGKLEANLYSINGESYTIPHIPGYPIFPLIVGFIGGVSIIIILNSSNQFRLQIMKN